MGGDGAERPRKAPRGHGDILESGGKALKEDFNAS